MNRYKKDIETLKSTESFDPEPFEDGMRRISWLQEWALLANAYTSDDITKYINTFNRFYSIFFTALIDEFITLLPTVGLTINTSALSLRKIIYRTE